MIEKFTKYKIALIFIFLILFFNISLAQGTPEQYSLNQDFLENPVKILYETPTIEITEEQPIVETDNVSENSHNESTYYMNTRPADFIQVINTNGTILNETYIYLQDKLIAKYDTQGEKFFYHPDHLGSTSLVTNESGDVVEDLLYLPYGDILSGTEISRFGYTGQENDVESGFIDYGARQYNPQFGRFLQPDPIISDIYNPQNLNRYSYVLNNPYKYTDETGENPLLITAAVGAAIGATSSIVVQYANTGQVNWGSVGISAAGGAIAGATGFGVGTLVAQAIGSSTAAVAISGALAGATAGETGALAESLFTNKDYIFDPARVITNAVIGGIAGTISGKVSNSNSATSNLNKNTINHIMQDKHNWGDVVDDPKDWKQVQGVIDRTIKEGKISKEGSTSGVYSSTSNINGNNIKVIYYRDPKTGRNKISNSYVSRDRSKIK